MSDELRPPECGSVNKGGKKLSDEPVLFGLARAFQLELVPQTRMSESFHVRGGLAGSASNFDVEHVGLGV